jgi:hypothetical protein
MSLHSKIQPQFHKFLKRRNACNLYDLLFHLPNPSNTVVIPILWHAMDDKRHMYYRINSINWDSVFETLALISEYARRRD